MRSHCKRVIILWYKSPCILFQISVVLRKHPLPPASLGERTLISLLDCMTYSSPVAAFTDWLTRAICDRLGQNQLVGDLCKIREFLHVFTFDCMQDKLPLIQNLAAFLVAAAIFRLSPMFKPGTVNLDLISKEGREKQDAKDMRDD
jgi:hypothetical protein